MSTSPRVHVLVVDDLADNRGLLAQILVRRGYRVSQAADGRAALAAIAADPPDLLLLDLMMPVMDGFMVLAALRDRPGFLPTIVVTAATERPERLRALAAGADDFVAKPVDPEELVLRVEGLLKLKRANEQLAAANDALLRQNEVVEEQVAERTQALSQANAKLQELDALKDHFLASLSHELRTPLNAVLGFASVLDDEVAGPLTAEQHRFLSKILAGTEVLLALINDLLDMSRIQAGKFSLDAERLQIADVCKDVVENLQVLAEQRHHRLSCAVAEGLPGVLADRQRLFQVLVNLVNNAIKFAPEGTPITIRAEMAGEHVRCEVEDRGPGIAPEDLPKLFKRFSQLEHGNVRSGPGTGLGLSIVKALVEAHGGMLGVRSEQGVGSVFWFTLPLAGAPVAPGR
ncbi:MAG: ntrB [Cyanobacteria bacterium RYN_339]|nr:ntrB [Cyanobacteria bacterium RYN_339]